MEKIKLNEDMCIGCGMCVSQAPENFTFDETHAKVINEKATKEAKEAADFCPVGAIEIENTED